MDKRGSREGTGEAGGEWPWPGRVGSLGRGLFSLGPGTREMGRAESDFGLFGSRAS